MYETILACFNQQGQSVRTRRYFLSTRMLEENHVVLAAGKESRPNCPSTMILQKHNTFQVYVLGCSTSVVFHLRLDEPSGSVSSNTVYDSSSGIGGSTSGGIFVAQALELSLIVGRPDSDEVGTEKKIFSCERKRHPLIKSRDKAADGVTSEQPVG